MEGFTLIESIVAVLLIAFGCFAAAAMQVAVVKSKVTSDNVTAATFLAESELEKLKTLPMSELTSLGGYEDRDLDSLGLPCLASPCGSQAFNRKVSFFPGQPTAFSCHVEVAVSWRDSGGPHEILREAIMTVSTFS
jgi:prepilin-type N-terminal cleavage/methylation domain-containing protein